MTDELDDELDGEVHRIDVAESGRLDAVITAALASTGADGLSRAQVQRLIEDGHVTLNGAVPGKAGAKARAGDAIEVHVPPPEPLELVAEPIPLSILFEDADVIVIDKPAGMVVHPSAGHATGTLVNALLHHCTDLAGIGGVLRPGIVHRLDKDTTGVMVATKTDRAHASLTAQFAAKSRASASPQGERDKAASGAIERAYLAITSPRPPLAKGTLRTEYGRHPIHRKKFSSKVVSGKSAVTHYEVIARLHDAALVRFVLETGRTHQIRVHAADHGWPLVGDPTYGHKPRDERLAEVSGALARQALHAATLAFSHPATGARMAFESPLPEDFTAAIAALTDP